MNIKKGMTGEEDFSGKNNVGILKMSTLFLFRQK